MSRDRQLHEHITVAVCRVLGPGIASVNMKVENGIVQISGIVDTPEERTAVERAIWSVPTVRGIVQRLRARRSYPGGPTDLIVARDTLALLEHAGQSGRRVRVEEGRVTIDGDIPPSLLTRISPCPQPNC